MMRLHELHLASLRQGTICLCIYVKDAIVRNLFEAGNCGRIDAIIVASPSRVSAAVIFLLADHTFAVLLSPCNL